MGKRSNFERRVGDFYATPAKASLPLHTATNTFLKNGRLTVNADIVLQGNSTTIPSAPI